MLIIIEGPPSAGKSTLAYRLKQSLVKSHNYPVDSITTLHGHQGATSGMRGDDYLNLFLQRLEDYTPGGDEHIICDEWHWAHPVYSSVFTATNGVPDNLPRYIDAKLAQLGAVIVHQDPGLEMIQRRHNRKNAFLHPHYRITAHLAELQNAYTKLTHNSLTTVLPAGTKPSAIIQAAKYREKQATHLATQHPFYLGPTTPDAILVEVDPNTPETLSPTNYSGASFLHKALALTDPHQSPMRGEDSLGMLNAAFLSPSSFVSLMQELKDPRVIALGRRTSQYLGDIPHIAVPHPIRTRRFYSSFALEYGQLIRAVAAGTYPADVDLMNWNPKEHRTDGAVPVP